MALGEDGAGYAATGGRGAQGPWPAVGGLAYDGWIDAGGAGQGGLLLAEHCRERRDRPGRQHRQLWQNADRVVGARGALLAAFDQAAALVRDFRVQRAALPIESKCQERAF